MTVSTCSKDARSGVRERDVVLTRRQRKNSRQGKFSKSWKHMIRSWNERTVNAARSSNM